MAQEAPDTAPYSESLDALPEIWAEILRRVPEVDRQLSTVIPLLNTLQIPFPLNIIFCY